MHLGGYLIQSISLLDYKLHEDRDSLYLPQCHSLRSQQDLVVLPGNTQLDYWLQSVSKPLLSASVSQSFSQFSFSVLYF